jgi:hypothetical protein
MGMGVRGTGGGGRAEKECEGKGRIRKIRRHMVRDLNVGSKV